MAQGLDVDLREIVLSNNSFGPHEIQYINNVIMMDFSQLNVVKQAVQELAQNENRSPATAVRLGVCYYVLGEFEQQPESWRTRWRGTGPFLSRQVTVQLGPSRRSDRQLRGCQGRRIRTPINVRSRQQK